LARYAIVTVNGVDTDVSFVETVNTNPPTGAATSEMRVPLTAVPSPPKTSDGDSFRPMLGGTTVNACDFDCPAKLALSTTVVGLATNFVVTENVAVFVPPGTSTEVGRIEATAGVSEVSETKSPPAGAKPESRTVPDVAVLPVTVEGERLTEAIRGAKTVNEALLLELPTAEAVSFTVKSLATGAVNTSNSTVVASSAILNDVGITKPFGSPSNETR
jgi:hypothetical protein